ncbi:hypothetical protein ACFQZ4_08700 [Catellatospora coxensis]
MPGGRRIGRRDGRGGGRVLRSRRSGLAARRPLERRLAYLDSPFIAFREAVAWTRDLPPEAYARLDADPAHRVRWAAAKRPDAPPAVLERMLRERGDSRKTRWRWTDHPNFPTEVLHTYADHPDERVRSYAPRDPALPPKTLSRLAADPSAVVRRAVAAAPGRPPRSSPRCWRTPTRGSSSGPPPTRACR